MSVIIKDLLELDLFKSARVEAGEKGLNNEIKRVNFSDCPILEDVLEKHLVKKNDLFINSLYIVKDDEEKMLEVFKFYVASGSCGVFLIDEFVKELPDIVKDYVNKTNFPVIFIDSNVPYAEIIKTIMEMILIDQTDMISEMQIDRLLDRNVSKEEVIKSARHINGSFKAYYISLFFKAKNISNDTEKFIRNELKSNIDFESLKYKNGILIIINFDKLRAIDVYISYITNLIDHYKVNYKIGVSNIFSKIENFHLSIRQSISSYEISEIINSDIVHYKDLNVYKVLYPLKETVHIREFYNDVFIPLKEYDDYYNSDLIKTIELYLENDGDYKKTALQLHQHENTIRYRILKAKKILDLEGNHLNFVEQISIALKINKIMKH